MKKTPSTLTKLFATIIVVGSVIYGCSTGQFDQKPELESSIEVAGIPAEYAVIGAEHNNGLEYAFQSIRKEYHLKTRIGNSEKLSKDALLRLGEQAVDDFAKENNYFGADAALCREVMSKSPVKSRSFTRAEMAETDYSPELQQLLARLGNAISHTKADGLRQLKKEIEILVPQAQQTLNETELIAFYAGVSTVCASMAYWVENYQKWQIALNSPELLSVYSDEELNDLEFKNGQLISGGTLMTRSWWDDAWSSVGETWDGIGSYVDDWWNNQGGRETAIADGVGATVGAIDGALAGLAGGPTGAAIGALAMGITDGAKASLAVSIGYMISGD